MSIQRPLNESWECMLPGPPSRSNGGSADLSTTGLLAYASGSSIAVVETHSMQLVTAIPLPPPSSSSAALSPFITSVRWSPHPLPHFLLSSDAPNQHLILAVGDRQGRICLLDLRSKTPLLFFDTSSSNSSSKPGIQDLCWVQTGPDSWAIAALSGPSLLSLYNTSTGRCFFKYDASPEYFSCLCRDPFDSRRFCALGLKGFLLSVKALGDSENDISHKELQIRTDTSELQKLERDSTAAVNGAPALATFPNYIVSSAFSPHWKHILFVTFPRELVVFDLQYETALYSAGLPRGCGKFLEVLPDTNMQVLYCAHLDGMVSIWRRKKGEQVYTICAMEELMPSLGSSVPSPSVLALAICHSDATLQNISKLYSDGCQSLELDFDNPFDFSDESLVISKTPLISISDDGKVWKWLLTAEGSGDTQKDKIQPGIAVEVSKSVVKEKDPQKDILPSDSSMSMKSNGAISNSGCLSNAAKNDKEVSFKINLVGQLHLLSSAVTMLAVPSPSLTSTLARGGNSPAVAVPLVALGTQNGSIEVIDVSANAVAASFSVHNSVVRGLRWLGNSRLVSFSYTQGTEKSSGFTNRLVVTCLRSGLNRTFRVLQRPERAPIRALRASSSGRYLLILFRDAPVEVWAMTKTPIMLRSLALPFTVLEWSLPTVPRPSSKDHTAVSAETSSPKASPLDSKSGTDGSQDEFSETFSFALVNGALGVFEVHGRRIRDFRPKWPNSSFAASDGLVSAMAYRLPHVVMGDRLGNIRWWDVVTGQSSSFNTHREGIRRIKFSPVVPGDRSRGRIAVLFYDNTFSVFDLDSPDPLANSLLQPQFPGTLVLELDWLPLRTDKSDPLILCIAGADSSFRLLDVNINDNKIAYAPQARSIKERYRPVPLCSPVLLPTPHAMALRTILQLGLKPSWFNTFSSTMDKGHYEVTATPSSTSDLCSYMLHSPRIGDSVVPEMLLKVLEPYRREGCLLDNEMVKLYGSIVNKGCAVRLGFAAAIFGEPMEALFWLQLPNAVNHWMKKLVNKSPAVSQSTSAPELDEAAMLNRISSRGKVAPGSEERNVVGNSKLKLMAFEEEELLKCANERIPWHEKLEGEEAIQNRVHELVSVGNLEAAVSLLLSTPPESSYFYANALRAVALSSAVSNSLLELAVKVVAANMVRTDNSLSGTHLLCAVGRYQEACSQLQDAGCWTDAATLAASHLKGSDYARVLQRWADHVLRAEHNIWRALILYVAAGAFQEALAALREAQQPDTAAMFILACREIHAELVSSLDLDDEAIAAVKDKLVNLPGLSPENVDSIAVVEYYGQYQRKLIHLCMDSLPSSD
ncbi:WD repeat-containing protein 11-like [Ipomoea triloba]|uniref:WD repeat-containing protein 11-like n=1 Tax=Ipomoea triloba TaxID=35885 RepID=UPI00125D18D4|nr:WD repeat-containing protein 11-like [Ipomoea triloba]XP_031097707.1 WD repeat-containing protein 11-like [Ipomoea triloba]